MCSYRSPSLSARSLVSGSETRSPPRRGRASGWGAWFPLAIGSRTARSMWSRSMPPSSEISIGVISRSAASCGSRLSSTTRNIRLPLRADGTGKPTGGGLISRGHLYKILSNPIYRGRLTHKGHAHDGLHDPIVDQETWDRVHLLLAEHAQRTAGTCQNSDARLAGKLFDDR